MITTRYRQHHHVVGLNRRTSRRDRLLRRADQVQDIVTIIMVAPIVIVASEVTTVGLGAVVHSKDVLRMVSPRRKMMMITSIITIAVLVVDRILDRGAGRRRHAIPWIH